MKTYYSDEENVQILISLMKQNGIRRVVASPGMTNVSFVASIQSDPFFEIYSSVDERSAAYIACGLAAETKEPVAISCTGATAPRNYAPGLTEAFYRKLPILVITSSQPSSRVGHNIPQVTDRQHPMPDIAKMSVELQAINSAEDKWDCNVKANKAILELTRKGGGPVHVNLVTMYQYKLSVRELPKARKIQRIYRKNEFPSLVPGKIAIFVGAHLRWTEELEEEVDEFCEKYDAVVLCDSTSNYKGKYSVYGNIVANQRQVRAKCCSPGLLIHLGDISGAYMNIDPSVVWRVNPDGEIRDTFRKLTNIFEMEEQEFFEYYNKKRTLEEKRISYYQEWNEEYETLIQKIPELPFSNIWVAWKTVSRIPESSVLHFGILNTLRCWNYFKPSGKIWGYSNVGGFGIDGCVSSLLGASLADHNRLYFGIVGDLAFFYDLNVLGNRHVGSNFRIMVINNGEGFEFRHYASCSVQAGLGDNIDPYIAAAGHYGGQSKSVVKNISESFGFEYLSAANKEEYLSAMPRFLSIQATDKPMVFEVFTDIKDENGALYAIDNLNTTVSASAKEKIKTFLGQENVTLIKGIIKK